MLLENNMDIQEIKFLNRFDIEEDQSTTEPTGTYIRSKSGGLEKIEECSFEELRNRYRPHQKRLLSHEEISQMQLDEAIARHVEQSEKAVAKIPMHLRTIISKSEIDVESVNIKK